MDAGETLGVLAISAAIGGLILVLVFWSQIRNAVNGSEVSGQANDSLATAEGSPTALVRTRRIERFQLQTLTQDARDCTVQPSQPTIEEYQRGDKTEKYVLQVGAPSQPSTIDAVPFTSGRADSDSSMACLDADIPTSDGTLEKEELLPDAVTANKNADEVKKVYSDEELARLIFGKELPISVSILSEALLKEPNTANGLARAGNWWAAVALMSAPAEWTGHISGALRRLFEEKTPEEDLYTPAPEQEVALCVLELLGYRIVEISNRRVVKVTGVKHKLSTDFIRAMYAASRSCCRSAVWLLIGCFKDCRLDLLLEDIFDPNVMLTLRNDKNIGALVAATIEDEVRHASSLNSPGEFEKNTALRYLASQTTIVPLSLINIRGTSTIIPGAVCAQASYFEGLPFNPVPTKLWCTNPSLLLRHTKLIIGNLNELNDLFFSIIEKAAKQNKEAILTWFEKYLSLSHSYFSIGGRASLLEDEVSRLEAISSGFILNMAFVLLKLMRPLFKSPEKFITQVDWEYTKTDGRIKFSQLSNMVDGSKPGIIAADDTEGNNVELHAKSIADSRDNNAKKTAPSFSTEIFWLTSRAMELVDKISMRRNEQMRVLWDKFDRARLLYETDPSPRNEATANHARQCVHTLHYGWSASPLDDSHFLSLACNWAKFASEWILMQAAEENAGSRFYFFPAGLVKSMCDIWILSAHLCPDTVMPGLMAADAALLCVELMGRPDLASSPVLQDRLLAVVDAFVRSGKDSLIGVVMNNQVIRETLAPAILNLYSNCHAVAALDVNDDVSFDKNSIRSRANILLQHLYNYPLEEPRVSIRLYVQQERGFDAFVGAAFDCIMYNYVEAVKTLKYNCKNEMIGRPVDSRAMSSVQWMLRLSNSTFELLQLLCDGEVSVRQQMLGPELRLRVSCAVYSCLNYVNSTEKLELMKVKNPSDWGYDEASIISHSVNLIASCLSTSERNAQKSFLQAFAEHPDFELEGLLRLIDLPGGSALKPYSSLIQGMEFTGAKGGLKLNSMCGVEFDIFAAAEEDADDIYAAFWAIQEQVGAVHDGFSGGHFFQRLHTSGVSSSGAGSNIRAILKDYKKTAAMLPNPIRDATIVVRYDDECPSYCRAFVTGPVDTPYFGGVFVFDIFFPKDFPNVPPQVQFLNTARGIERFHPNLYADGKVCVSLLGTFDGESAERWDPKQSCLGQVLVSIQSLILGEYSPGAVDKHVTIDGRQVSSVDYSEYRLATMRYAVIALLKGCRGEGTYASSFPEFNEIFLMYFRTNRHRLLQALEKNINGIGAGSNIKRKLEQEVAALIEELTTDSAKDSK